MKSISGKVALCALVAAVSAGAVVGCSSDSQPGVSQDDKIGKVGLNLEVAPGVTVNTVTYSVTGNGQTPITGQTIDVSDPNATASVFRGGLLATAPGQLYTITMSATSVSGTTTCEGSSSFPVVAGSVTSVTVALQCTGPDVIGSADVGSTTNACPVLTSWVAAPTTTSVGALVTVSSSSNEAGVTYAWTATNGGSFASATSASTTYTCGPAGPHTLTVTISDGQCTDSATIPVNCIGAGGGGGTGGTGGTTGGTAGTGGTTGGTAGTGGTTGGTAGTGGGGMCPNGIVESGESCDALPVFSTACGADCQPITSAACLTCETEEISVYDCSVLEGTLVQNGPAAGLSQVNVCNEVLDCVRDSGCAEGPLISCYCGSASPGACASGMGNGLCRTQIERGLETSTFAEIDGRYTNIAFGGGLALFRASQDQVACTAQCL